MIIFKVSRVWCMEGDGGGQGNGGGGAGGEGGTGPEITPEIVTAVMDKWRDHLPEELATDSALEGFNGKPLADVVKGYASLSRKLGKNPIVMPGENATEEDWGEFFASIGRPEDGKGYEIGKPEDAPEGWEFNPKLEELARGVFHQAGLRPEQAKQVWDSLMKFSTDNYSGQIAAHQKWLQESMGELKTEWGGEFGARSKGALQLANELGIGDYLTKTGLDKNPVLLKAFGEMWNQHYREGDLGGGGGGGGQLSSREALSKIKSIRENPEHPYNNPDHPGFNTANDEMANLHEIAFPEDS